MSETRRDDSASEAAAPEVDPASPDLSSSIVASIADETLHRLQHAELVSHPAERGRARENAIAVFLREIVPPAFGIGTGFVIDTNGRQSLQQDVVVFRRDYHPVFRVGGIDFFTAEGTAAVIEVKTRLDSRTLSLALTNLASVKALDRTANGRNYRIVGGHGGTQMLAPEHRPIDPQNHDHQIFGAIAAASATGSEAMVRHVQEHLAATPQAQWPNVIAVAGEWSMMYDTARDDRPSSNQMDARGIHVLQASHRPGKAEPLVDLAEQLWSFLRVAVLIDVRPHMYLGAPRRPRDSYPLTPEP